MKPSVEKAVRELTKYLALVVSDGARPATNKKKKREFETGTWVDLHVQSTVRGKKAVDLRAVLRKLDALAPFVAN